MYRFQHFKGFRDTSLDLCEPLTVLIGPNGSGKSNAIEGIELLSAIASGAPLHEITDIGRGGSALEVRGGLQGCPRFGSDEFTLGLKSTIFRPTLGEPVPFEYSITVRPTPTPRIVQESLVRLDRPTIPVFANTGEAASPTSSDARVAYDNHKRGGAKPTVGLAATRSALSQYESFAVDNRERDRDLEIIRGVRELLRVPTVLDPVPRLCRTYNRIGEGVLTRNGANISSVLHALHEGSDESKASLQRLLDRIKLIPEEPFVAFHFVVTELKDVIFALTLPGDGAPTNGRPGGVVDARILSDGTLRSLAVLTALETVARDTRLIVEEFDNGVHPSRVGVLTQAVSDCASRRGLRVLLTTHNPATLDSLRPEQLDSVRVCVWRRDSGAIEVLSLREVPRVDELLQRGKLGDLVTRRVLQDYLAPHFEEDRRKQAEDWLKSLP